ncbi:MAG: J domain-containing protein [Lysobacter sp.]
MNRWYGKLIGVVLGIALMRFNPLFGALVGLLIGHAFDSGWFSGARSRSKGRPDDGRPPREDPYAVLGVSAEASDAEIERAYRRLISRHHPDRVGGDASEQRRQAAARAGEINRAYKRIKVLRKRL